jgi:phosphoribosylanthranilate isomerase
MPLHVKICGITNALDARVAVEAGADAVGLIFAPSARHVTPEQGQVIRRTVPPGVDLVGVFVEEPFERVREAVLTAALTAVQFHRDPRRIWSEAEVARWEQMRVEGRLRTVRALKARDAATLRAELVTVWGADQVLLDAFVPGAEGGTGETFDWSLVDVVRGAGCDVIVAGGLTPDNVADAVRATRPWGVDVASGVEASPGIKDHEAVRRFIAGARAAAEGAVS